MAYLNNQTNKDITTKILYFVVFVLIIIALFIIHVLLNTKKETITEEKSEDVSMESLVCSTENPTESFFNLEGASKIEQKYTVSFYDDHINTMMYILDINYPNEEMARLKEAELYTEYEKYMHGHGLDTKQLSYSFIKSSSSVKAKLYIEKKNLTPITAKLFLLDSDTYSAKSLQSLYERKSFICNYKG